MTAERFRNLAPGASSIVHLAVRAHGPQAQSLSCGPPPDLQTAQLEEVVHTWYQVLTPTHRHKCSPWSQARLHMLPGLPSEVGKLSAYARVHTSRGWLPTSGIPEGHREWVHNPRGWPSTSRLPAGHPRIPDVPDWHPQGACA